MTASLAFLIFLTAPNRLAGSIAVIAAETVDHRAVRVKVKGHPASIRIAPR